MAYSTRKKEEYNMTEREKIASYEQALKDILIVVPYGNDRQIAIVRDIANTVLIVCRDKETRHEGA